MKNHTMKVRKHYKAYKCKSKSKKMKVKREKLKLVINALVMKYLDVHVVIVVGMIGLHLELVQFVHYLVEFSC